MKRRQLGITLIELMVVVVIIGILTAIAIPSYRRYVVRANRADAKVALTQTAAALERCYTNSTPYTYNGTTCTTAGTGVVLPFTVPSGTYVISHVGTRSNAAFQQTYVIRATPQGTQATNDTECAAFQLTNTGLQSIVGGTGTAARCWRR